MPAPKIRLLILLMLPHALFGADAPSPKKPCSWWRIGAAGAIHTLRAMAWPIAVTVDVARMVAGAIKKGTLHELPKLLLRVANDEKFYFLGFLGFAAGADTLTVTQYAFLGETGDFDKGDPDALTVIVEATPKGNFIHGVGKLLVKQRYQGRKNVVVIEPKDYADLREQLAETAKKHGKIARLEVVGHGTVGKFQVGEEYVGVDELDASMPLKDVFARDAKIRLHGCLSGNGAEGADLMRSLGTRFLDGGGEVYGSRLVVSHSPIELFSGEPQSELAKRIERACSLPMNYAAGAVSWLSGADVPALPGARTSKVMIRPR